MSVWNRRLCFSLSLNSQISRPHSPGGHDGDIFEGHDDVNGDHDDHFEGHDDVSGGHDGHLEGHDDGDDGDHFV